MVLIPEIMLKEISRIFVLICGLNGIKNKSADLALQKANINNDYFNDTMIATFIQLIGNSNCSRKINFMKMIVFDKLQPKL